MKKLFYIFLLLFGFTSLDAQGWYKFYDQYPSAEAEAVVQIPNGNYIVAGSFPTPFVNNELFPHKVASTRRHPRTYHKIDKEVSPSCDTSTVNSTSLTKIIGLVKAQN